MLNADADVESLQDLLGHTHFKTTQRYLGKVSDLEAMRCIEKLYG
jgi:site-specific recombinase XerD